MEIIVTITAIIILMYFAHIVYLIIGFTKIPNFTLSHKTPETSFTIVVPFRNEAENLPILLDAFSKLNYPKNLFEVILIDDDSDAKFQIPNIDIDIKIIDAVRVSRSPKKDAIQTAIELAKHNWILTTDADCVVQTNWLATFNDYILEKNPKMIAAGVIYNTNNSFLDAFQQLDLLSLQGTTIGSFGNRNPFMCNGANFCYQKLFFHELDGFKDNNHLASGDDVFLLQKAIKKEVNAVQFLKSKDAVVFTQTQKTWQDLFFQRVRWASKTTNYNVFYAKFLGLVVFSFNGLILLMLLGLCFGIIELGLFILLFALKFTIDFILLYKTSLFFKINTKYVLLSSITYPFFSTTVVIYSFFGGYSWKGRRFLK
jgi:glycosyltransferase involved in cell wall biosynthesis